MKYSAYMSCLREHRRLTAPDITLLNLPLLYCRPQFSFQPQSPVCSYQMNWHGWGELVWAHCFSSRSSLMSKLCIHSGSSYVISSIRPALWYEGSPAYCCTYHLYSSQSISFNKSYARLNLSWQPFLKFLRLRQWRCKMYHFLRIFTTAIIL